MVIKLMLLLASVGFVATGVLCVLKACGLLACTWFWALFPAIAATALAVILIVPILVVLRIMLHEGRDIP